MASQGNNTASDPGGVRARTRPTDGKKRDYKYSQHWDKNGERTTDTEDARDTRKSDYIDLVNDYYDAATDIYLESWGQSFHMCRYPRGPETKVVATTRHEHYIAHMMSLRPGMRVLDVGCGVGGPAREIATFADCNVVGLNNNGYQVKKAQELAKKDGLEKKVQFIKGDFMDLPFAEGEFDAVFVIEATVHAPSLEDVYAQIYRVLKPGGVFGVFEWVLTDAFDPEDTKHQAIRSGIERGNGIAALQTKSIARSAIGHAGFELQHTEDLAERDDPLPWWYPISGDLKSARGVKDWVLVVRNTKWGRVAVRALVRVLELVRVAPKGTTKMTEELIIAGDSLVAGGKGGLFTPMYLMVGKKPVDASAS